MQDNQQHTFNRQIRQTKSFCGVYIFSLKNSGVSFICVDMPELATMTLGVFATFAQSERERISERITNALAEKKRKGVKLGKPENLTNNFEKAYTNSLATRQPTLLRMRIIEKQDYWWFRYGMVGRHGHKSQTH